MAIKNLLTKLHKSSSHHSLQTFCALYLTDDVLQVSIWTVQANQVKPLSFGQLVSWDGQTSSSLVQAVDQSLTSASNHIDSNLKEPNQIVFGLPTSWLNEHNQLLSPKKKLLKHLSHQLELKPLGFTLFLESLVVYLQQQEGTPLNALLFHLSDLDISLSLIRQGKFIQRETIDRTDDLVTDIETLLKRLDSSQPLPSRILLFDGHHDLQASVQLLNTQDWSKTFNFLHLPQIEALPKDIGIRAVTLVGGTEVAKSLGLLTSSNSSDPLTPPIPTTTTSLDSETKQLQDLGFAIDQDQIPVKPHSNESSSNDLSNTSFSEPSQSRFQLPHFSLPNFSLPHLHLSKPTFSFSKKPLLISVSIILFLSLGLISFFWFVPHAKLTLYLQPKNIQTKLDLSLDSPSQNLSSQPFHHSLEATKSIPTTGSGLVGDKAQGEVTIYNRTTLTKTFPQGTQLQAKGLKFTLLDSVTVASQSTAADYTETPGKAQVKIQAVAIGDQYNLPANTEFQVANYALTSFVARNSEALSGGSSHQVKLVSQSDRQRLFNLLTQELQSQFDQQIASQSSDLVMLKQGSKVLEKTYSHQVGDETDQLQLTLKLEFYGLAYRKQDINHLIQNQLQDRIPLGFHPLEDSLKLDFVSNNSATNSAQFIAQMSLLPDLDQDKLKSLLKGKSPSEISQLLHSLIPEFSKADLKLTPRWLPPRLRFLPFNPHNIQLSIQSL